jgi:hypothetical protein
MARVMCLHFSMEEGNVFEHTKCKCIHFCQLVNHCVDRHSPQNTIVIHIQAKCHR